MARNTIGLGALLTLLGLGTFALVRFSPTLLGVLLPAAGGVLLMALGVTALRRPQWRSAACYAASGLAALLLLITAASLPLLFGLSEATLSAARTTVVLEEAVTALLCGAFLVRAALLRFTPRAQVKSDS